MKEKSYPGFRWFVIAAMGIIVVGQGVVLIAPAPLVGIIAQKLKMTIGQATGGTMGLFTIIVSVVSIAGGPLMDKLGSARSRILSLALMLIGTLLVPIIGTSFKGLLLCRAVQAVGAAFTMGSVARIASDWFPPNQRSLAVGLQAAGQSIGIALGFGLIPVAFARSGNFEWSLTTSPTIVLAIGAVLGLIVLLGPKPPVQDAAVIRERIPPKSSGREEYPRSELALKSPLKLAIASSATWVAIIGAALMSWAYMAFNDLTPGYLAIDKPVGLGLGPVHAGQIMICAQISFMLGCIFTGIIIEKLFGGNTRPLLIICTIGTAICVYAVKAQAVISSQPLLLMDILLAGLFLGPPLTAALGFLAKYYPNQISGTLGGLGMGAAVLLGAVGLNVNAYLLHTTGFYFSSITLIMVLSIVSFFISLFLTPPNPTSQIQGVHQS
jgi:MFS family permease